MVIEYFVWNLYLECFLGTLPLGCNIDHSDSEDVRFAAILTGKEEVPILDTYDTGLAVFQPKGSTIIIWNFY